jgi:hypothetical protein
MPYINQPIDLQRIFKDLNDRLNKLETAGRFTFPNVTVDPTYPRIGDAWLNITDNEAKIVDSTGTVRVIDWT